MKIYHPSTLPLGLIRRYQKERANKIKGRRGMHGSRKHSRNAKGIVKATSKTTAVQ